MVTAATMADKTSIGATAIKSRRTIRPRRHHAQTSNTKGVITTEPLLSSARTNNRIAIT